MLDRLFLIRFLIVSTLRAGLGLTVLAAPPILLCWGLIALGAFHPLSLVAGIFVMAWIVGFAFVVRPT